jgi:hypothetical protein
MISETDKKLLIVGAGAVIAIIVFWPAIGRALTDLKESILTPPADAPAVDPDNTLGGWLWDMGHNDDGNPNTIGHITDFWMM